MTLSGLLRSETHAVHRVVEQVSDLPRSIRTRADYVSVLRAYAAVHGHFEAQLTSSRFAAVWPEIGIDLDQHRRLEDVARDLADLNAEAPPALSDGPQLGSFGEALGCLYVLEGSALGGRFMATDLTHRFDGLPVRFLSGTGRNHPAPWRAVQRALRSFDTFDVSYVLPGAVATFDVFATRLAVTARMQSTQ